MLSATPRLPDEDSTMTDPGRSRPSRSAAATIPLAALSFTDPAKLSPSTLRNSGCPITGRRSMNGSCWLYSCGWEMTVTIGSHLVGAELRCPARPVGGSPGDKSPVWRRLIRPCRPPDRPGVPPLSEVGSSPPRADKPRPRGHVAYPAGAARRGSTPRVTREACRRSAAELDGTVGVAVLHGAFDPVRPGT